MPAKTETKSIQILLEDVTVIKRRKGYHAIIYGYGEGAGFSKWYLSESDAKKAIEGLSELINKKIELQYYIKDGYKNWDKWEPPKTTPPKEKEMTQEQLKLNEEKAKEGILAKENAKKLCPILSTAEKQFTCIRENCMAWWPEKNCCLKMYVK